MIAEKIEKAVRLLEALSERENNDLKLAMPLITDGLRVEIERVRGLEAVCMLEVDRG